MAVRKRGNSWEIDYFEPCEGGGKKRVRQSFKTKKEADAEHEKRRTLVREKRYLDVKREYTTTFDELMEEYVKKYQHQKSFEISKTHFINTLKEHFSGKRVSEITYKECDRFLTERKNTPTKQGKKRSASTLNKELGTLKHMLNEAVAWEMIEKNPFHNRPPRQRLHQKEKNGRVRYLSTEEMEALLPECPPHLREIVEVNLLTGMRRGEVLSLKWSQIAGDFIYLHETKTDESRQIPIAEDLKAVFQRIRQRQWARGIKARWVFCDDQGRHFKEVKRSFASACKRAGIADFRFHDLRHTFASHYVMRGGALCSSVKGICQGRDPDYEWPCRGLSQRY
jgi:integrase